MAVGVCSSCIMRNSFRMRSSLRSISSRRRRTNERLLSEVKNSPKNEAPAGWGKGGALGWGLRVGRANQSRPLLCGGGGSVLVLLLHPHRLRAKRPLGRFDHGLGLVYLRQRFVR